MNTKIVINSKDIHHSNYKKKSKIILYQVTYRQNRDRSHVRFVKRKTKQMKYETNLPIPSIRIFKDNLNQFYIYVKIQKIIAL